MACLRGAPFEKYSSFKSGRINHRQQAAIILADEPTGNLDSKNAAVIMELLQQLHQKGATMSLS